jgi:hypothetical protein
LAKLRRQVGIRRLVLPSFPKPRRRFAAIVGPADGDYQVEELPVQHVSRNRKAGPPPLENGGEPIKSLS